MIWGRDTHWGYIHLKRDQKKAWEKAKEDARREFTKEQEEEMRKKILKEMRDDYQTFIENTKRGLTCDYAPQNESGVVFLFGRYYDALGFSKIVSINTSFPDCYATKDGEEVVIEFEFLSSGFISHQKGYHSDKAKDVDYVVCWEKDVPLKGVKIIELKKKLKPFFE